MNYMSILTCLPPYRSIDVIMEKQANDYMYKAQMYVKVAQATFNEKLCNGFMEIKDLKEVEYDIKYHLTYVDKHCAHFREDDQQDPNNRLKKEIKYRRR
jgi:hypothetical protein